MAKATEEWVAKKVVTYADYEYLRRLPKTYEDLRNVGRGTPS